MERWMATKNKEQKTKNSFSGQQRTKNKKPRTIFPLFKTEHPPPDNRQHPIPSEPLSNAQNTSKPAPIAGWYALCK
jgi:hypothetical protein